DLQNTVTIEQVGDSLDHFVGSFAGPEGTAYEGGRFVVDIVAPPRYPFEPLKMKFVTKVYHPNISSQTGFICLDILKSSWSPVFTLRTCLVSLQSLLSTPEPSDPQDAEVAKHYLTDRQGFESTARYWTEASNSFFLLAFLFPSFPSTQSQKGKLTKEDDPAAKARLAGLDWADVKAFTEMGFPADQVVDVLRHLNYRGSNKREVGEDAVIQRLCG
ncbi:hypothetical protein RHOSPDRAFT_21669, partial [Rhodotorula sp. JG-1b]